MRPLAEPLSALLLLSAAPAPAAACASLAPVPTAIELVVEAEVEPRIVSTSTGEMRRLARQEGRPEPEDAVTRGLASSAIRASAELEIAQRTMAGAGTCTALRQIAVRLAIPAATIHVDSRYPPGSCEHAAVLAHEREHVRIAQATLRRWQAPARERLAEALAGWRDRWLDGRPEDEIRPALDRAIAELMQRIQADGDSRHAAIDTPASYDEVRRQCSGW